jgi:parallel beta-helix repeat protein
MNFKVLISAALASVLVVAGCSSDGGTAGTGGSAGGGGEGGNGGMGGMGGTGGGTPAPIDCATDLPDPSSYVVGDVFDNVPVTSSDDCTGPIFPAGGDAANRLNTRLENADVGDVVCLEAGTYQMDSTINISLVDGLTVKGIGESPDDTELLFGGPGTGIGIFVQKDDVTIENLHVRNTGANGIEQDGTNGSVFRKVHVSWDDFCDAANPPENCGNACVEDVDCGDTLLACEGDQGKNGAYGIYPTNCENTTVEFSQATGASDAGIYIGKCGWLDDETTGGVVQYNIAANNVAGLEVENCKDVVAHDNLVFGNTGGLMPLQQPIAADRPANTGVLMENNKVYCNNGKNFAETGVVQIIPVGSGLLSLGGQGVEIRNNDVQGNDTLGLALVSSSLTCDAAGADCPPYAYDYNPYAEMIYAHDNYFLNNGTNADTSGDFGLLFLLFGVGTPDAPSEDVIWDGNIRDGVSDPEVCLGSNFTGTFRNMTNNMCADQPNSVVWAACATENSNTDTTGRLCDLDPM